MSTLSIWNQSRPGARNCKDNCDGDELSLVGESSSDDESKCRSTSSSASCRLLIVSWADSSLRAAGSINWRTSRAAGRAAVVSILIASSWNVSIAFFYVQRLIRWMGNIVGTYSSFKVLEDVIPKSSVAEFRAWRPKANMRVQWCVYTTTALPFLCIFYFHVYSVILLNPSTMQAMSRSGIYSYGPFRYSLFVLWHKRRKPSSFGTSNIFLQC
jgi:hypothetical protein